MYSYSSLYVARYLPIFSCYCVMQGRRRRTVYLFFFVGVMLESLAVCIFIYIFLISSEASPLYIFPRYIASCKFIAQLFVFAGVMVESLQGEKDMYYVLSFFSFFRGESMQEMQE